MSIEHSTVSQTVHETRERLSADGYAETTDTVLGFAEGFREHMLTRYFTSEVLHCEPGDIPADRERARDVVRYAWDGDDLSLAEHDSITLGASGNLPGDRECSRVRLLEDPMAETFIRRILSCVPDGERSAAGTFGINLFRTHTDVVTTKHQDGEAFVVIYVLDKVGSGAETHLYTCPKNGQAEEFVYKHPLAPGELIIFRDRDFLHTATPITPSASRDEEPRRDVLVCTVDLPGKYGVGSDEA